MSTLRLLVVFAVAFSLVGLTGALSSNINLPSIHVANAQQETSYGSWYPAGAQERTLSISQGGGATSTCLNWLQLGQVDTCDVSVAGIVNCSSTGLLCSAPVPDPGYYEIQFNLAGVLWGIPMEYGNNVAGLELRQGFAHLFNKQSFTTNNSACLGAACVPDDQPLPVCTTSTVCANGGLPAPNPCNWDTKYAEASTTNCVVGSPAGTSYNCSFSTTCPTGTVSGTTTFPWQAAIGSPDFCAAAQHFIQAFNDVGVAGVTTNANCELVPPAGGWPSPVTTVNSLNSCAGVASTANACAFVRTTEPRLSLGRGLTQDICALFSPAWGAWTTLSGQPFSCDSSNTGTGNSACGGGSCPFLQESEGTIGQFCGFTTSATGTPDNCWGFGTFGFGQVYPFDSTTYFEYNSVFADKTTVTCTNADCTTSFPGSTCAGVTASSGAADYMYVCSPTYDQLSSAMEFSMCLTSPGPSTDPLFGQSAATFANCSGVSVPGGNGATSCIGSTPSCSAVSAGYQAEDYYGSHAFTLPVYDTVDIYARSSNWPLGGSSPGFTTALGGGFSASANYFNWINAYSSSPAVAGTFRQGFLTAVDNLNPFDAVTQQDFYVLGEIYDTLFKPNPLCAFSPNSNLQFQSCQQPLQLIDWMTTSHSFLCYSGGPSCTATALGYGNATYFAGTTADLRLTLNRSNHWQDAGPVTAWDVKYSFIDLNATGAFQAAGISGISYVNVLDEYTVDIGLKARGPFTEYNLGSVTIIPGHIWSACSPSTWNSGVTETNVAGATIVSASEDTCVGHFGAPSLGQICPPITCNPLDPLANGILIGSGPYTCESTGGTGHPAIGTIGGGCSIDNTQAPPPGLGDFTLTRTGCTLTATGTTCGVAGSSSDYFRSSGALASYVWTGDIGSGSADFSRVLTVNSCHSSSPSANCPHWAQGIGNPGGTGTNMVGLSQRLKVNSYKGVSWINFATPQSNGSLGTLTCAAGYTLPGTTITPCNVSNAGWSTSILPYIGGSASTLYEVGSQITIGTTTTGTSTLSPATVVGCTTSYPNGGYDC